jgi:heterotetrameric sarcosine oxidase gamma subunit
MYDDKSGFPLEARSSLGTLRGAMRRMIVDQPALQIFEEAFLHLTSLRLSRKADITAFIESFPTPLAQQPNTFTGTAAHSAARFEPRAWMLIGKQAPLPIDRPGCVVSDLSARLSAFRIQGAAAERTLRSSTGVIPAENAFVRTLFAESYAVLLQRVGEQDYRMLVDVSLAQSCVDWLADAASLALA